MGRQKQQHIPVKWGHHDQVGLLPASIPQISFQVHCFSLFIASRCPNGSSRTGSNRRTNAPFQMRHSTLQRGLCIESEVLGLRVDSRYTAAEFAKKKTIFKRKWPERFCPIKTFAEKWKLKIKPSQNPNQFWSGFKFPQLTYNHSGTWEGTRPRAIYQSYDNCVTWCARIDSRELKGECKLQ